VVAVGSVKDEWQTGRPSAFGTEESVSAGQITFQRGPGKSINIKELHCLT
jgi:hypothetical protein